MTEGRGIAVKAWVGALLVNMGMALAGLGDWLYQDAAVHEEPLSMAQFIMFIRGDR